MPQADNQSLSIFISYRRDDTAGHAGRLYDRLSAHFGSGRVFIDVDLIEQGEDFAQVIEDAVGSCDVLLALIGRNWLTIRDEIGLRLDNSNDFVRLELAAALARGVRVIPVLVQGARMPRPQDLPEDLLPLSRRNALELSDLRWKHDVDQLLSALEKILARQRGASRTAAQEEAERYRRGAESERRKLTRKEPTGPEAEVSEPGAAELKAEQPHVGILEKFFQWMEVAFPGAAWLVKKWGRLVLIGLAAYVGLFVVVVIVSKLTGGTGNVNRPAEENSPAAQPSPGAGNVAGQRPPPTLSAERFNNAAGMEFIWVAPGEFMMGSENGEADERPVHRVSIGSGFYMGKCEVTQAQWQKLMGNNPSHFKGESLPVEMVWWHEAQKFIEELNRLNDGYVYRLPTEAEWEYAARAGTTGDYAGDLDSMAWYYLNSGDARLIGVYVYERGRDNNNRSHPVGLKQPNAFGLFDMHGNVAEWVEDFYHDSYGGAPTDGSAWPGQGGGPLGNRHVVRGGSWKYAAPALRSADRDWDLRDNTTGFRAVAVRRQ